VKSSKPRFLEILRTLARHKVDFIVVGGISAVLQGAPVTTFDLDVLHARDPENIRQLLTALGELDAVYRAQPERQLRPASSHPDGPGHQLLLTKFGPLDVLGMIGKSRTWDDLVSHCGTMEIDPGTIVRVLDLETLIAVKEELGSPKDVAVLPVLREALKEQKSGRKAPTSSE
jgi:hypothetical protein